MNPDRLAELEEERRFLLASIRDLEREHDAGDVDDADFVALRDGYVARAAAVMHEIDDGRDPQPSKPERAWWRRAVVPLATVVVAVALGVAVSQFAGQRLPGQTLTGGQPADEVTTLLAQARSSLGSDPAASLAAYQQVTELEPDNVEARTYIGWLIALNGEQSESDEQVQQGIELLRDAAELDDTYADPHCFLAVAERAVPRHPRHGHRRGRGAGVPRPQPAGQHAPDGAGAGRGLTSRRSIALARRGCDVMYGRERAAPRCGSARGGSHGGSRYARRAADVVAHRAGCHAHGRCRRLR